MGERPAFLSDEVCATRVHCRNCRRGAFGEFACPARKITGAERGLGDVVAEVLETVTGGRAKQWAEEHARRRGRRTCGCARRQRKLNAAGARLTSVRGQDDGAQARSDFEE